jgi:hypothetical protein
MQAVQGLNFSKAYDQRVYVNKPRSYAILQSAAQVLPQVQSALSSLSTQTITFNVNPSENSVIDRNMSVRYYLEYTINGTTSGAGVNIYSSASDCLKPLPVSSSCANCTVQLNGQSFTNTPKDYVQALLRFCDPHLRSYNFSMTAAQPDFAQEYSVWDPATNVVGLNRSPFNRQGGNVLEDARGSYPVQIVSNTTTQAVLRVIVTEPLFISPLLWQNQQAPGLVLLNQMSVQLQLSNLAASWSHMTNTSGNTRTVTSINVAFFKTPELLYSELNPKGGIKIEKTAAYSYPYNHLYVQENTNVTLAAGASTLVNTNTISLPVIPEKVYIFAKRTDNTRDYTTTETFAGIENIAIKWGTQAGILSQCSQQDLWKISVKNGLRMSWNEFSQYSGSVLSLAFGDDIDLGDEFSAPGLLTKLPLQLQIQFRNLGAASVDFTPYVVVQYPGVVQCVNGLYSQSDGIFTEEALRVLQSQNLPVVPYTAQTDLVFGGFSFGDLFSGIKKGIQTAMDVAQQAKPFVDFARKNIPGVEAVTAPLSMLGIGRQQMRKSRARRGGMLTGGMLTGGMLTGGCGDCGNNNVISRSEMLERLEESEDSDD